MTAPAAVIRIEIEARPTVRFEDEGEPIRLVDWLDANDDLAALVARALEAIETREAS